MAWLYDPDRLIATLEGAGFDVDRSTARLEGGGSLKARRDLAGQSLLIAVNAGGRLRVTRTASVSRPEATARRLGGIILRSIVEETRQETAIGTVASADQFEAVLRDLLRESGEAPAGDGTGGPW